MTDSQRLRHLLKQIQIKLTNLGPTNRARWTVFSTGSDMSVAQFSRRISTYGIKVNSTDVATIFKAAGINGSQLNFNSFEKLLTAETNGNSPQKTPKKEENYMKRPNFGLGQEIRQNSQENYSLQQAAVAQTPPQTPTNPTDKIQAILFTSRRALLMKCLDADPLTLGRVQKQQFIDIVLWFGISDTKAVTNLANSLEEDQSGLINYMAFVDFLCGMNENLNNSSPQSPTKNVAYNNERNDFYDNNDDISNDKQDDYYAQNATWKKTPPSPLNPDYELPPVNTKYELPPELQSKYYNSAEDNRAQNYSPLSYKNDPLIFGKYAQRQVGGSAGSLGPRRNLDPNIFGYKPHTEAVKIQKLPSADDVRTAERIRGLSPGQVVQLLSTKIFAVFRSAKTAFSKWRQNNDLLTVDDLRDGFARDCNVNLSREDLMVVVNHYGGPMTMSTFMRMLSDGSRLEEMSKSPGGHLRETEDEEMLNDIAGQIKKGGWEDIIFRCGSADEIAAGFDTLGVKVTPEVIHTLASKYGKTGLIDALRAKTQ